MLTKFIMRLSLLLLLYSFCFGEEFVGPFPSWTNVKSVYGAKGDGTTDDTPAIQAALSTIGPNAPVLYFPAGTYLISQTLTLAHVQGVSLLCQDPATTALKWTGSAGGTLLNINGMSYSRVDRCTFDGGGTAGVLVDQAWDGMSNYFDTGNEYVDDVFKNGSPTSTVGIRGGKLGFGFAETTVKRCQFLGLFEGIHLWNFNALDLWVWDSLFDSNFTGITNFLGAGNWHVYNSVFRNSGNADNHVGNTGGFSFIGNYSSGPGVFVGTEGSCAPATMTFQGNSINSTGAPVWGSPISIGNQGPMLLVDNRVGNSAAAEGLNAWNWCSIADVISVGNQFAQATGSVVQGRQTSVDDLTGQSLTFLEPPLPPTAPNLNRMIFEVPMGADSATFQGVINAAVTAGSRSVVHVPAGMYNGIVVTVPPSDIQIVGDSQFASRVNGNVELQGPGSHVLIREMWIQSVSGDTISVDQGDQPGARVMLDGALMGGSQTNVLYDGLSNLTVDLRDLAYSSTATGLSMIGTGAVNVYSAASFGSGIDYSVTTGNLVVRDEWHDSGTADFLHASGPARVSVVGSHVAGNASAGYLKFNNFTGSATVASTSMDAMQTLTVAGVGQVLGAGLMGSVAGFFSGPATTAPLINSKQSDGSGGATQVPNQGTYSDSLLRSTMAQMRATVPGRITDLPAGITDIQIYRVQIAGGAVGVHLLPSQPAPPIQAALAISKSHTGNFYRKQKRAIYTVAVSNAAQAGPTIGTVTVQDTLPNGLSLVSMVGTGWNCASGSSCSRGDALNPGLTYPLITITVNVAPNASAPLVNRVSVSGGGSMPASAQDPTIVTQWPRSIRRAIRTLANWKSH